MNRKGDSTRWNVRHLATRSVGATQEITAEVHLKWVNYLNVDHDWQEIDCLIEDTGNDFRVTKAPFNFIAPKFATDPVFFESDNRYDIFNETIITAAPLGVYLTAVDASPVEGELFDINDDGRLDAVIYYNAFPQWDADLIYYVKHGKSPRLEKLVRFNSTILENLQVKFKLEYTGDVEISPCDIGEVRRFDCHWDKTGTLQQNTGFYVRALAEAEKRGIGIKNLRIWDSGDHDGRRIVDVDSDLSYVGNDLILTKHIPASFFDAAVLPVFTDATITIFPDPDPETTSVDGALGEALSVPYTWEDIQSGPGDTVRDTGFDADSGYRITAHTVATDWAKIFKNASLFDTSSLTLLARVTNATVSFFGVSKKDDLGILPNSNIYSSNPASNTALVAGDFDSFGTNPFSADLPFGSILIGAYNDYVLNPVGISAISKTSITKLGLRNSNYDVANIEPAWTTNADSNITMVQADKAGLTEDPKLVITFVLENEHPVTIGFGSMPAGLTIEYQITNADLDSIEQPYTSAGVIEDSITATESGYRINTSLIKRGVQYAVEWRDTTDVFSGYEIYDIFRTQNKPLFAIVEGVGQTPTVFDTNLVSSEDDNFNSMFVRFKDDTPTVALRRQTRPLAAYDGTTLQGQITVAPGFTVSPAVGDELEIF